MNLKKGFTINLNTLLKDLLGFWFDHDITVDENGTNDSE